MNLFIWARTVRWSLLWLSWGLFLGCRQHNTSAVRGFITPPPSLSSSLSGIKGQLRDLDPLADECLAPINLDDGRGYLLRTVDPRKVADEYKGLRDQLGQMSALDLVDPEIRSVHQKMVARLDAVIGELAKQVNPALVFYLPMLRVENRVNAKGSSTSLSLGPSILKLDIGIEVQNLGEELLPIKDLSEVDSRLSKVILWCRNKACQVGNLLTTPKSITALKAGISSGHGLIAKGLVALSWKKDLDSGMGTLFGGRTALEAGFTAFGGLVSILGYVDFLKDKYVFRLPVGVDLNLESSQLIQRTLDAISAGSIEKIADSAAEGIQGNPFEIEKDFYVGLDKKGRVRVSEVDTRFGPDSGAGYWQKRANMNPIEVNKLGTRVPFFGVNKSCK